MITSIIWRYIRCIWYSSSVRNGAIVLVIIEVPTVGLLEADRIATGRLENCRLPRKDDFSYRPVGNGITETREPLVGWTLKTLACSWKVLCVVIVIIDHAGAMLAHCHLP